MPLRPAALAAGLSLVLALGPLALGPLAAPAAAGPVVVDGRDILVDGRPFVVHGAAGWERLDELKTLGANAIRTYGDLGGPLLDAAQQAGLKVALGFWLEPPRRGFDYSDPKAVAGQMSRLEAFVQANRNHPALLLWGIGNEVEAEAADPDQVYSAIGKAARHVKALDPDHPTMAVLAETGDDKVRRLMALAPDIDVLGVNSYGEAIPTVVARARAQGWKGPVIVTELGPLGQWDAQKTPWGAAVEPDSGDKAARLQRYLRALEKDGAGEFVFFWGQKQEVTPTWHGQLLESGEWTETAEAMAAVWGGQTPGGDRAPRIAAFALEGGDTVPAGRPLRARLAVGDPDGDRMTVEWTVLAESRDLKTGGDAESRPRAFPAAVKGDATGATVSGLAPGAYRLFVTVRDGRGAAATANRPFLIE